MRSDFIRRLIRNLSIVVLLGGFGAVMLPSPDAFARTVISPDQCINSLKKLELWPPPDAVTAIVRAYCARGDLQGAVTVIQEAGAKQRPDVIQEAESKSTFLMAVEDVFSITGRGTVAVGRIQRGKVKVGDRIEIVGFKGTRETYVTGIGMFGRDVNEAVAGDSVGLLLRGIPKTDIERGMVLAQPPGSIKLHQAFEATIYVLSEKEGGSPFPLSLRSRHQFYMWTTDIDGIIKAATEMIMPGDRIDVTVDLIHPIAIEPGMRFAIRKDGQTVGAGVVLKILK